MKNKSLYLLENEGELNKKPTKSKHLKTARVLVDSKISLPGNRGLDISVVTSRREIAAMWSNLLRIICAAVRVWLSRII